MQLAKQIVNISDYQENVFDAITAFLNSVGVESEHTKKTYETAIRDFFRNTRDKEIEYLQIDDLKFTYYDVELYRNSMIGKFKNSTINTKMVAVKKMYDKLARYGIDVQNSAFDIPKLREYDTESYDMMTIEEVNDAIDIISKTRNGYEKSLLIKVAFSTALRKDVLLKLKWSDISVNGDNKIIKTLGKGNKWSIKKIDSDLYDELMTYKSKVSRDNVFSLSASTVQRMMNKINESIDFGDRKITFHSFKKASIEEMGIQTNYDIKAMQKHGDHSDASTTLNIYLAQKDIDNMPTLSTTIKNVDLSPLEHLTKEQLIDIIKKADRETQIKLLDIM